MLLEKVENGYVKMNCHIKVTINGKHCVVGEINQTGMGESTHNHFKALSGFTVGPDGAFHSKMW